MSDYYNRICFSCSRHVQVNNESAIDFYKKFGFEVVETYPHYYKRIEPADAHVLQKTLKRTANGHHASTAPSTVNGVDQESSS